MDEELDIQANKNLLPSAELFSDHLVKDIFKELDLFHIEIFKKNNGTQCKRLSTQEKSNKEEWQDDMCCNVVDNAENKNDQRANGKIERRIFDEMLAENKSLKEKNDRAESNLSNWKSEIATAKLKKHEAIEKNLSLENEIRQLHAYIRKLNEQVEKQQEETNMLKDIATGKIGIIKELKKENANLCDLLRSTKLKVKTCMEQANDILSSKMKLWRKSTKRRKSRVSEVLNSIVSDAQINK